MLPYHSDPGNKQIIPFFAKESQWLPYFQRQYTVSLVEPSTCAVVSASDESSVASPWPLPDVTELEIPAACSQPWTRVFH